MEEPLSSQWFSTLKEHQTVPVGLLNPDCWVSALEFLIQQGWESENFIRTSSQVLLMGSENHHLRPQKANAGGC